MSEGVIKESTQDILELLHADLDTQITALTTKRAITILRSTLSDKDCSNFLESTNLWSAKSSWRGLPKRATSHRRLTSHLHDIMLAIFRYFNYIAKSQKSLESTTQTSKTRLTRSMRNAGPTLPGGSAPQPERVLHLLPRPRRGPEPLKRLPDGLITGISNHFKPSSKDDSWYRAVAAFDVRTDREWQASDSATWLFDLAYYAQETFATQKTRQFVYGLVITESHLRIYRFDRCGVVEWPWLNYCKDPAILVRTLLLIGNHDLKTIGVDPTVTFNTNNQRVFVLTRNRKPVVYTQVETSLASTELCERATMCWIVEDKSGNRFLLKQQFSDVKRLTEGTFLKGVDTPGIMKIHFEQRYEKVSTSRGERKPYPDSFYDRVMVRSILDLYGAPIDLVKSRLGLLLAMHDVIAGHRDLWLKHNVLHRDISFGNILYADIEANATNAVEPTRPHGVLIDFDLSLHYDPKLPRDKYEVANQTGTTSFQSLNTLSSDWFETSPRALWKPLHDHIEELESFFWVLYWTTSLYGPPEEIERLKRAHLAAGKTLDTFIRPPSDLDLEFDNTDWETSAKHKINVLRYKRSSLAIPRPGWGKAYEELIQSFVSFCDTQSKRKMREACRGGREDPVTMEESRERAPKDYEAVLELFRKAIKDLEAESKAAVEPKRAGRPLRELYESRKGAQLPPAPAYSAKQKRSREYEDETPTDPITEPADSPHSKRGKTTSYSGRIVPSATF
ncbi:hypothetical protein BJ165DRAFT_1533585 [Panaeolus papilionaceus]|nr:hypothetical protein BJ165DRAFT_1533585 [Panaeolus papilionaceus]